LIYEHTRGGPARQGATADAIDAKAFRVFSAATVVIGLGSFVFGHPHESTAAWLYGAAVGAYISAGCATWTIVRARALRVVDLTDRWWPSHATVDPVRVLARLLNDLAQAAAANRVILLEKGRPLEWLLVSVAVEAVLVAATVISGAV
jgi:hypothetical protein